MSQLATPIDPMRHLRAYPETMPSVALCGNITSCSITVNMYNVYRLFWQ